MPTIFFQAAAGLLTLLGLAVPVAIHLWNRRPGRTVRVGSVRWLTATANRRLRNLRLEQWLLLLLRSAIVALLAAAVAEPRWRQPLPPRPVQGIVLLAPDVLQPDVLPALRPTVDSLRRRGYELRLLARGFRHLSAATWASPDSLASLTQPTRASENIATAPEGLPSSATPPDDYWARARQAADSFPGRPLRVLSGARMQHFGGLRPALPTRLTWQSVPLPDSAAWLASATVLHPDTLHLLIGRSRDEATTFRTQRLPRPRTSGPLAVAGLAGLRYVVQSSDSATLQPPGQGAVPVQTAPLRVALHAAAAHTESARCLRAALRAAALGLAQPLELSIVTPQTPLPTRPNWLFWLSDEPVPAAWNARVQAGAQLWQEAVGPGTAVATELDLADLVNAPAVGIRQLVATAPSYTTEVLWQDGTGRPVLTRQPAGAGHAYRLHTRLQTAWSHLPDSPALPALLLDLLRPAAPQLDPHDMRQLDTRQLRAQLRPATAAAETRPAAGWPPAFRVVDLRPWVMLAAAVLFALERAFAHRRAAVALPPVSS